MFMDRKTQSCQHTGSSQLDPLIQYNLNGNSGKLLCRHQQIDSEVDMERQNTQNSQPNIGREEQCCRTDTTRLQDSL